MPAKKRVIDGDSQFALGMNSQVDPMKLSDGFYRASMNTVNRGGIIQCRPGYQWKFTMPEGKLQGGILLRPLFGAVERLVFAVDGLIYSSLYPFTSYAQVGGLEFRDDVENIFFCVAEKGAQRNADDSIKLITPYRVVMIQDGYTPPGVFDGNFGQHLPDRDDCPIGTVMGWSGDRLWVIRDRELYASDVNDPFSFREGTYLSNARSFLLPGPGTAMTEINSTADAQLLVFTASTGTVFKSNIRQRTTWNSTEKFQQVLLPSVGCLSHRSVVTQFGLTWWYSQFGVTNLNTAESAFISSELKYQDGEMAISKGLLAQGLGGVSMAAFENYLLASVPHADVFNTHTWVLDHAPAESKNFDSPDAWNSYWTGTRPVEWASGQVQGEDRIFQFSKDIDGQNRCWEAFSADRHDQGAPITWSVETRGYNNKNIDTKEFCFAEIKMSEFAGNVDVAVFWAGVSRGAFKRISTKSIRADEGIVTDDLVIEDDTVLYGLKPQSRTIRTEDVAQMPVATTSCGIESPFAERLDEGFQLLIVCSGPGAIRSIQMFMNVEEPNESGECQANEEDPNYVRFDGVGSDDPEDLSAAPELFTATKTVTASHDGLNYDATADGESVISQADADKIATERATADANVWLDRVTPPHESLQLEEGDPDPEPPTE